MSSKYIRYFLAFVVFCSIADTTTVTAQSVEDRFSKARTLLLQRYDSVSIHVIDYPNSKLAVALCKRLLPGNDVEAHPLCREDFIVSEQGFAYSTTGVYDIAHYTGWHLRSSDGQRHYVIGHEYGRSDYDWSCDSTATFPTRTFLNAPYDQRRIHSFERFAFLYDVENGRLIDSGGMVQLYDNRYVKIVRDDKINFFDVDQGLMYDWNDPITSTLVDLWVYDTTVRIIQRVGEKKWRILMTNKQPVNDLVFMNVGQPYKYELANKVIVQVAYPMGGYDYFCDLDIETCDIDIGCALYINTSKLRWWYCSQYQQGCIESIELEKIENRYPSRTVRRALVMIELCEQSTKNVVYRKRHWVNLNLSPGEIGSSGVIRLDGRVWVDGDLDCRTEILEVE